MQFVFVQEKDRLSYMINTMAADDIILLLSSLNILASTLECLMPVSKWSGPARCALTHGSSFTQVLL